MNKNTKIVLTLLALGLIVACKESVAEETPDYSENVATDSTSVVSSSAAVENKNSNRKFVRTADVKFKVKNVAKSTYAIEDATTKAFDPEHRRKLTFNISQYDKKVVEGKKQFSNLDVDDLCYTTLICVYQICFELFG